MPWNLRFYWEMGKVETLPKAQRTRGLSSTYQSNFFRSYHKFKNKSWSNFIFRFSIKHQLQNLNKTSASQLNLKFTCWPNLVTVFMCQKLAKYNLIETNFLLLKLILSHNEQCIYSRDICTCFDLICYLYCTRVHWPPLLLLGRPLHLLLLNGLTSGHHQHLHLSLPRDPRFLHLVLARVLHPVVGLSLRWHDL